MYLFELVFLFSLDIYLGEELLDHTVVLFLVFSGTSILFSIVVATIYIPTNNAQVFCLLNEQIESCANTVMRTTHVFLI